MNEARQYYPPGGNNMFKEFADQYYEEAKAIREDLHRHPELSYKEFRTAELIEKTIANIGRMGRDGMRSTDVEILKIMLGK